MIFKKLTTQHAGLKKNNIRYLNLGCGSRIERAWVNIDSSFSSPYVQKHDLRKGIPFPDNFFAVVYHSHLLEHFSKVQALSFLKECYRVLEPGGIIRVVVPDLEQIVKMYLQVLEKALQDNKAQCYDYEWMMLELYDQAVREVSGGMMLDYLRKNTIPNEAFVYERVGGEARNIVQKLQSRSIQKKNNHVNIRKLLSHFSKLPQSIRELLTKKLLGKADYEALKIGRFRLKGEIHQWMYDRYSLALLLKQSGFQNPIRRTASVSAIKNWSKFNLDIESDGTVYKPDSLYMEVFKPRR